MYFCTTKKNIITFKEKLSIIFENRGPPPDLGGGSFFLTAFVPSVILNSEFLSHKMGVNKKIIKINTPSLPLRFGAKKLVQGEGVRRQLRYYKFSLSIFGMKENFVVDFSDH